MTTIRALLPALALAAALVAPPAAGAADRHSPRGGGHPGYRSSHHEDRYRAAPPRHRHDYRAPHYRPRARYYAPRYRYYGPRYYGPRYYYRPYPAPYYAPVYPVPVYPAPYGGYPPPPYRGGVHGGVHLGVPGFGFSLYF